MRKYRLLLDESGSFWGNVKKNDDKFVSVVGGVLLAQEAVETFDEAFARKLFVDVKKQKACFSKIKINPYHGMEETDPANGEYVYTFLSHLSKINGVELVLFYNAANNYIVDNNSTYLIVFIEGIVKLINDLLSDRQDEIELEIFYAGRQNVNNGEGLGVNAKNQIAYAEYSRRLAERLNIAYLDLPENIRSRVKYTFKSDLATSNSLLMLADIVCFGKRGGYFRGSDGRIPLTEEIRGKIDSLPCKIYRLGDYYKWDNIQKQLTSGDGFKAIELWYLDDCSKPEGVLYSYKEKFEYKIISWIKELHFNKESLNNSLSNTIKSLIENRNYDKALNLIDRLENEFCELLSINQMINKRLLFDLYFHKVTVLTHLGRNSECVALFEKAKALIKAGDVFELKDYSYIMSFFHREIEMNINMFRADEALALLDKMIENEKTYMELAGMFSDVPQRSSTLGKLYGTYIRVVAHFYSNDEYLVEQAKEYAKEALDSFDKDDSKDKSRMYQNIGLLYLSTGKCDEAFKALALALDVEESIESIAEAIVNISLQDFLLLYYVLLMSLDDSRREKMYKVFVNKHMRRNIDKLTQLHPKYLIYYYLGKFYSKSSIDTTKKLYVKARELAFTDKECCPVYCAGLKFSAEYALLQRGKARIVAINETLGYIIDYYNTHRNNMHCDTFNVAEDILRSNVQEKEVFLKEFISRIVLI